MQIGLTGQRERLGVCLGTWAWGWRNPEGWKWGVEDRILCGWPSEESLPHSTRLFLSLAGTSLLSVMPSVPCDQVPSQSPRSRSPRCSPRLPASFHTAPMRVAGAPTPSPCLALLRSRPAPLSAAPCRRAAVRAAGPAVQPEPLPAGAAAALAAACGLRRPLRRHLLAAVPALRARRSGGRVPTLRAARGLRPAPGWAAGTRRHAAAPATGSALHRARGRAQRRLRPSGRRGSHLRAGHSVHRTRG